MTEALENESRKEYCVRCRRPEVEFFVCGYCGFIHEPEDNNELENENGRENDSNLLPVYAD